MLKTKLVATTVLGLCLAMAPLAVGVSSAQPVEERPRDEQPGEGPAPVFVPLVEPCVSTPSVATCEQVRAVIAECADELDHEGCSVLFEKPGEVFENPLRLEASRAALSRAADAIAAMEFPDDGRHGVDEATRADAERTLLLGDENLMSHSPPPLLEGDAPAPRRP